ncbi:hypothetical protein [Burkholderia oklahomensis]|nr:hypothetical protein [Burkholderia oklahomensis]
MKIQVCLSTARPPRINLPGERCDVRAKAIEEKSPGAARRTA